jgi:hypothetical protein
MRTATATAARFGTAYYQRWHSGLTARSPATLVRARLQRAVTGASEPL